MPAQPANDSQHHPPTSSPLWVSSGSAYTPNERGGGVTTLTSKSPGFRALRSGLLRLPESCGLPPLLLLPGRSLLLARATTACMHRCCWVVLLLVLGQQAGTCGVNGRREPPTETRLCIWWLCCCVRGLRCGGVGDLPLLLLLHWWLCCCVCGHGAAVVLVICQVALVVVLCLWSRGCVAWCRSSATAAAAAPKDWGLGEIVGRM